MIKGQKLIKEWILSVDTDHALLSESIYLDSN